MRAPHWLSLAVLVLAIAAFARFLLERQESSALQGEIALLTHENRRIAELRSEHERLLAARVSDAELERLRNDRAALGRLRVEINKLEESAGRKARALQDPAAEQLPAIKEVREAREARLEKEARDREAAVKAALEMQEKRRADKKAP